MALAQRIHETSDGNLQSLRAINTPLLRFQLMRILAFVATLILAAACSGSKWQPCKHLEITTLNSAGQPQWLRYENARYRVLDTDPFTLEWEHTSCVEIESQTGTVDEVCGRELQAGPVERVACR